MPLYNLTNIKWDTSDEDQDDPNNVPQDELGLPRAIASFESDTEDEIADALSDIYDFAVISFDFQEIPE